MKWLLYSMNNLKQIIVSEDIEQILVYMFLEKKTTNFGFLLK